MTQSNKIKGHLRNASTMSFADIVKGSTKLVGNTISLGFKAIGATVYVANQAVSAGLKVGKAAYDEVQEGYTQTDDLLSSKDKAPEKTSEKPQQMEFDFE